MVKRKITGKNITGLKGSNLIFQIKIVFDWHMKEIIPLIKLNQNTSPFLRYCKDFATFAKCITKLIVSTSRKFRSLSRNQLHPSLLSWDIAKTMTTKNNNVNFFFFFFVSGFSFTTIDQSQDCRGRGRAFL